jgi:Uma2 family endonuclease
MSTTLRITLAEYDAMIAADAFAPLGDRRIELIHGEIREMNPPGPTHETIIDRLNEWSNQPGLWGKIFVRVQNSIGLPNVDSAPQPDLAWTPRNDFTGQRPSAKDVLLLIEVAESSLLYDLGEKLALYASAGIAEYWVVDLVGWQVHVMREPRPGHFASQFAYGEGTEISPQAFPNVRLSVDRLFGRIA